MAALHFLEQCSGSNDLSLQPCYRASRVSIFSPPPGLLYPYVRTIEKFIKHIPFCHCFLWGWPSCNLHAESFWWPQLLIYTYNFPAVEGGRGGWQNLGVNVSGSLSCVCYWLALWPLDNYFSFLCLSSLFVQWGQQCFPPALVRLFKFCACKPREQSPAMIHNGITLFVPKSSIEIRTVGLV